MNHGLLGLGILFYKIQDKSTFWNQQEMNAFIHKHRRTQFTTIFSHLNAVRDEARIKDPSTGSMSDRQYHISFDPRHLPNKTRSK